MCRKFQLDYDFWYGFQDMKEVKRLCSAVPSFSAKKDTSITEGNPTGMSAKVTIEGIFWVFQLSIFTISSLKKSDSIREIKKSQDRKPLSLTDDTEVSELTYGIKNIPHILSSINLLVFLLYSQIMWAHLRLDRLKEKSDEKSGSKTFISNRWHRGELTYIWYKNIPHIPSCIN